jgi:magnesium-transporting ATPase (P-type)
MSVAPDRPAGDVFVRSFVGFVAGYVAAFALAFFVFGIWRRNADAPDENFTENAAMAAYMLFVTAVPAAAAFALVTCPWRSWRSLRAGHGTWLSVAAALATCVAQLTGLASVLMFLPLPRGFGAIMAAIRLILPGVAAGLVSLAVASLLPRTPAERPGEP